MMNQSFCSDVSQQMGEDLIGSATPCQTFVLIECPFPWKADAFKSKLIPQSVRDLVISIKSSGLPVQFLLINHNLCQFTSGSIRVIIYQRSTHVFSSEYQRYEWVVEQSEEIAPLVRAYLSGQIPEGQVIQRRVRDLLVCVHGSYDKCCARYGLPFCQAAAETLADLRRQLKGESVRLWQTSHFGGHRFAPTLIDFPTGRYYGRMTLAALQAILTRSGSWRVLDQVYRGWSILPVWLQIAERPLIERYGWSWFDHKIAYRLVNHSSDGQAIQAKLSVLRPDNTIHSYAVDIERLGRAVVLKTSCKDTQPSEPVKYIVRSLSSLSTSESFVSLADCNVYKLSR